MARYTGPNFNALVDVMKEKERMLGNALAAEYADLARRVRDAGRPYTEVNEVLSQTALEQACSNRSQWSGGHSVSNLAEQVRQEFALRLMRSREPLDELFNQFDHEECKTWLELRDAERF